MTVGEVYAEGRRRVSELVSGPAAGDGARPVPTCPGWTVSDVLAHLVGVCADIIGGNLAGVATDAWTAAQVRARRGTPLAGLVDEWSDVAPQVEAMAEHFPREAGRQWVADLTTHEHDMRTAVGEAGARASEGVIVGLDFLVGVGLQGSVTARALRPLGVSAGDQSWMVGNSDPYREAGLVAAPFELFRCLTGRRSVAQIRQLDWRVAPGPYLPAFEFGPFTTSPCDVIE